VFILPATITIAPRLFGGRARLAQRSAAP
jgi:hypothetical protein